MVALDGGAQLAQEFSLVYLADRFDDGRRAAAPHRTAGRQWTDHLVPGSVTSRESQALNLYASGLMEARPEASVIAQSGAAAIAAVHIATLIS